MTQFLRPSSEASQFPFLNNCSNPHVNHFHCRILTLWVIMHTPNSHRARIPATRTTLVSLREWYPSSQPINRQQNLVNSHSAPPYRNCPPTAPNCLACVPKCSSANGPVGSLPSFESLTKNSAFHLPECPCVVSHHQKN